MYTALHSWSFRDRFQADPTFDIYQALDLTAEMGFQAIEILCGKANVPEQLLSEDAGYLHRVVEYATQRGVRIVCLSTYNDFAYVLDEQWRLANIDFIKRWLPIAANLGVPNIRMLTGYYRDGQDRERLERLTLDGIAECVPIALECGVHMAVENHNSIFFSADDIRMLMARFGSPPITACPDPSNWVQGGIFKAKPTAEQWRMLFGEVDKLAPYMTEAHLKVTGVAADGTLLGWGAQLDTLLRCYQRAGYTGAIAFESVADDDLLAHLPHVREVVEAAIARVSGEL